LSLQERRESIEARNKGRWGGNRNEANCKRRVRSDEKGIGQPGTIEPRECIDECTKKQENFAHALEQQGKRRTFVARSHAPSSREEKYMTEEKQLESRGPEKKMTTKGVSPEVDSKKTCGRGGRFFAVGEKRTCPWEGARGEKWKWGKKMGVGGEKGQLPRIVSVKGKGECNGKCFQKKKRGPKNQPPDRWVPQPANR